ncbi:MAG TPA: PspC domain-containing protein [Verrucomicrobiae bacterium]|nr:PspC domain-containing protein [Verrucomicrobiae bacterium]
MICGNCRRDIAENSNFCYLCGAPQHAAPASAPSVGGKRLMRSVVDCKIAGVCGGIAEYLEIDSTLVRLIWVLLILMPVPLVPAFVGYFVAWLVMPQAPYPMPQAAPPATAPHSTTPA